MSEQVVKWVTRSYEGTPIRTGRRAYNDPTADAAIGRVMAEERKKKRQEKSDWLMKGSKMNVCRESKKTEKRTRMVAEGTGKGNGGFT